LEQDDFGKKEGRVEASQAFKQIEVLEMMEMIQSVWPSMRVHANSRAKGVKKTEENPEVKEDKNCGN
jgi:hypothetical protein